MMVEQVDNTSNETHNFENTNTTNAKITKPSSNEEHPESESNETFPTDTQNGRKDVCEETASDTHEGTDEVKLTINNESSPKREATNDVTISREMMDKLQTDLKDTLSSEVAQVAPLLVGKYYLRDEKAVWSGRWGMNEAAFLEDGLTSRFEMSSEENVKCQLLNGNSEEMHPSFQNTTIGRSNSCENPSADIIVPAFFGYEHEPSLRSSMPFDGKYGGSFQIQANKNKPQTVVEKNVKIRFVHDLSCPERYLVTGSGENRFGFFTLHGLMYKTTSQLQVYKVYKPKEKERKVLGRRGRTPRAATQSGFVKLTNRPNLSVITSSTPSGSGPPTSASIPSRRNSRLQIHSLTSMSQQDSLSTQVSTPGSSVDSPSLRNRSSRKRVVPAYLREENSLEYDNAPAMLKKCHSIIKRLMANSKAGPFLTPVDPVALGIPDYFKVIKEPMDLGTIRQNLESGFYSDASILIEHVRLVFSNAMLYNAAHSQVHIFAQKLMDDFGKRIRNANIKYNSPISESGFRPRLEDRSKTKQSNKKLRGGKGAKGNSKRRMSCDDQGLINSLREDIERLKATLEQLQPGTSRNGTPKQSKPTSRPFKMEDLTEEELNRAMSKWEISKLSADIKLLPQNKISRVLQIISEAVPVANLMNENDEIELDFESFDTRCLRMLEGYVRESDVTRKRKRPTKKSKVVPPENRLKSAQLAALNIRNRQEELRNELAQMEGARKNAEMAIGALANGTQPPPKTSQSQTRVCSSDDSSSSSSDSSESDNDSDSDSHSDTPNTMSSALMGAHSMAQRTDAAKKIRDVVPSEPLKVENKGAWSMLAKKDTMNGSVSIHSEVTQSSSLWLSARSMEQMKQQQIKQEEKERNEEMEAQRQRQMEQREKEKQREREEFQRRKEQQEFALKLAQEERVREARHATSGRPTLLPEAIETHHTNHHVLKEDLESFSSSSFL
uniref:Uncharacterized protein AlNc14C139G7194 n=1 Tax=Albugo laibachii Nc14 TaxID=890382 RepID=F0WL04_9STRA|nr:conserved hypothetical protein [Albugo laibachii Nc14]|eukprot:CCA21963.1 conserved hypothetical protein [Albugo laibachii Nc14]